MGATWQAVCQFVDRSCNVPLLHPTLFQFLHGAGELEVKVEGCCFFCFFLNKVVLILIYIHYFTYRLAFLLQASVGFCHLALRGKRHKSTEGKPLEESKPSLDLPSVSVPPPEL